MNGFAIDGTLTHCSDICNTFVFLFMIISEKKGRGVIVYLFWWPVYGGSRLDFGGMAPAAVGMADAGMLRGIRPEQRKSASDEWHFPKV